MEIVGNVKNYDWGKLGMDSEVAKLAAINDETFHLNDSTPYSELWMGAHPSGQSKLKTTGHPLGNSIPNNLPYLFKVLSIRKALSIQVHPNKIEAERLHKDRPDVYKDDNHKPELAIALTPFLALCGFRPYAEIYDFCQKLPPLKRLVGGDECVKSLLSNDSSALKECYKNLMTSDEAETTKCVQEIAEQYEEVLKQQNIFEIFHSINGDFPNDVGTLSLFFLNVLRLQVGQAIFLAANEIHAYLSGDCIECMACSDNVIRAGLTPKYKDVGQLISCLNYVGQPASHKIFQPHRIDDYLRIFVPPVEDFAVAQLTLPNSTKEYKLLLKDHQQYGSILLVLKGSRIMRMKETSEINLSRGSIVYIPPGASEIDIFLNDDSANEDGFTAYIAMYNYFKN